MKHGPPLSVAYENGQYREYLILVEELIKNTLCKILLSCEYAFVFFSFFLQTWFSQRRKFYIWYQIKKWMICLRFSHDSNFIFLTNVLCSTSLYRYQISHVEMTTEIAKIWKTHNCLILFVFFFFCALKCGFHDPWVVFAVLQDHPQRTN